MSYRKELQDLINELREEANKTTDLDRSNLCLRRAEIIDFAINFTEDFKRDLDSD